MPENPITVLLTASGSTSAMNCIKALRDQQQLDVRIIGVDVNAYCAGLFVADRSYLIPRYDHPNYTDTLIRICDKENVDVILPTYSSELPIISANIKKFHARNIHTLIPSYKIIKNFENKWLTCKFFESGKFRTPKTFLLEEYSWGLGFPAFIKPVVGSGSKNSYRVNSLDELNYLKQNLDQPYIIQEFLVGNEYTVDVLANSAHEVLVAIPRERIRVREGLAVVSRTVDDGNLIAEIERIVEMGKLVGPLNIQGFMVSGDFYFTEINCRFAAGGLPLTIAAGANMPVMAVKLALGMPVNPIREFAEGLVMLRYYTETFVQQTEINHVQNTLHHVG
jgi:carbamoyl-phosphate synthase large subunit